MTNDVTPDDEEQNKDPFRHVTARSSKQTQCLKNFEDTKNK